MLIATETGTSVSQAVRDYSLKEVVESQPEPDTYAPRPAFILSEAIRERGEELTDLEALILNVAQTLLASFKNGMPVSFKAVRRVIRRYHDYTLMSVDLIRVASQMEGRGLCQLNKNLRLMKHFRPEPYEAGTQTGFQALTSDPMEHEVLVACKKCCGVGFKTNRNVSARAAVQSLMFEKFRLTRRQFKKLVRGLIITGVLEEVPSKGTTAFRLTESATAVLKGRIPEVAHVKEPGSTRPELELGEHSEKLRSQFSEHTLWLVHWFYKANVCNQITRKALFEVCLKNGMSAREIGMAIAELLVGENAFLEYCSNTEDYFFSMNYCSAPNRETCDLMEGLAGADNELRSGASELGYPDEFVASLPQHLDNFNDTDLAEMYADWDSQSAEGQVA